MGARDLDRVFDCFGARGHEHRLLGRGPRNERIELFSELHRHPIWRDHHAGMREGFQLLNDSRFHTRMQMPCVHDRDATGEVNEAPSFDIPELCVFRPFDIHRQHRRHAAADRGLSTCMPLLVGGHVYLVL